MAQTQVNTVEVRGVRTCVPARRVDNAAADTAFASEDVQRVVKMAGVRERHVVNENQCTSDLCFEAASRLLRTLDWPPESVDLLIFVAQTPDYLMPSTACLLQHRLGLSTQCGAFDVNLGCSAYPYGLCLAAKMLDGRGLRRALVLVGETPSKLCHPADRATWLIFGDAGSATALEFDTRGEPFSFSLHSDGSGAEDFIVRAGGFRNRFAAAERSHYIEMNGANIFAFTMERVPPLVYESLQAAGWTLAIVDSVIFHQANAFIVDHLRRKLGLSREKVPLVIDRFGNTGGSSLPLAMTQGSLARPADRSLRLLLLAFGVGLSWGSVTMSLPPGVPLIHSELA